MKDFNEDKENINYNLGMNSEKYFTNSKTKEIENDLSNPEEKKNEFYSLEKSNEICKIF